MIQPLYCAPPREVKYAGNSGIIILKLEANRACDKQSSKKGLEYRDCGTSSAVTGVENCMHKGRALLL